jgi:hypothetical protein
MNLRRLAAAGGVLLALAVPSTAHAAVGDGYGGWGETSTQCQSSVARPVSHNFSATLRVHQDYAGQNTAVQVWVYDARGWWNTGWGPVRSAPFMGYLSEGVPFAYTSPEIAPANGYQAWVYVFYAWQNRDGTWRFKGEQLTTYTELSGYQRDYCFV